MERRLGALVLNRQGFDSPHLTRSRRNPSLQESESIANSFKVFVMKLGGTTDIKFVRPKQTRHLFCLGRFCILRTCFFASWNMTFPFAAVSGSRAFSSLYAICADNNFVVGVLRRIYRFSNILLRKQQFSNTMLERRPSRKMFRLLSHGWRIQAGCVTYD